MFVIKELQQKTILMVLITILTILIFFIGVKSKKEDWLKYDSVKQKKLKEIFTGELAFDF